MAFTFFTNTKRLYYILVGLIVLVVFFTFILILRNLGGTQEEVTLQFWGVFDERRMYEKTIAEFKRLYPHINVAYTQKSFEEYEAAVINGFASRNGPDIWLIHNTWVPKHGNKLVPFPDKIPGVKKVPMTINEFKNQFVDVAFKDLVFDNKIYALPLYVDTLAMYYNKDHLNAAGITRPPKSWNEFNTNVEQLTKIDGDGNITKSGAALGTARNVNRSTDILMALMMQSGVQMTDRSNAYATFAKAVQDQNVGQIALEYYTDFANPSKRTYTWNDSLHYSIDAFAQGEASIMFNYAHQIELLKDKAPHFDFGLAPLPQLDDQDAVNYANYWAPAVAATSANPNEAWLFVAYLTSKEGALSYLSEALRPSARRDIIDIQRTDGELGVFAVQALSAKSWFQVDSGAIERIFADMIDDVNFKRRSIRDAITNAESRVSVLISKSRSEE